MTISEKYQNAKVILYYASSSSYSDTGRIVSLDTHWIELAKDNGDALLIPVVSVRLIKLLESDASLDEATLLRPALPSSDETQLSQQKAME